MRAGTCSERGAWQRRTGAGRLQDASRPGTRAGQGVEKRPEASRARQQAQGAGQLCVRGWGRLQTGTQLTAAGDSPPSSGASACACHSLRGRGRALESVVVAGIRHAGVALCAAGVGARRAGGACGLAPAVRVGWQGCAVGASWSAAALHQTGSNESQRWCHVAVCCRLGCRCACGGSKGSPVVCWHIDSKRSAHSLEHLRQDRRVIGVAVITVAVVSVAVVAAHGAGRGATASACGG